MADAGEYGLCRFGRGGGGGGVPRHAAAAAAGWVRGGARRRRRTGARGGGGGLDEGRGAAARYAGVGPGAGARGALGARALYSRAILSSATTGAPPLCEPLAFEALTWAMSFSVKACESDVPYMKDVEQQRTQSVCGQQSQ